MIPLSLKNFALAVGAHPKWVLNAKPRLGRELEYSPADAQWLRLTRVLNRELRIPLQFAAGLAGSALEQPEGVVCVCAAKADGVRLCVDLRRDRASFAAVLASAIAFGGPRRSGRKRHPPRHYKAALAQAWRLGINVGLLRFRVRSAARPPIPDHQNRGHLLRRLLEHRVRFVVAGDLAEELRGAAHTTGPPLVLEICYAASTRNMRRLAKALRELQGSSRVGPIAPDLITLRSTAALAPTTLFGTVCLRRDVAGVGRFEDVIRRSTRLRAFGLDLTVLDLPALAQARTASSRREDIAKLPMLETLLALPALEERYRELAANRS